MILIKKFYTNQQREKAQFIVQLAQEALKKNKKILFLVPEQFHFDTEKRLYKLLGARNISKVNITSFTKLSAGIVQKYAGGKVYADDAVKAAVMWRTLKKLRPALTFYTSVQDLTDFSVVMLDIVAQFRGAGMTADALRLTLPSIQNSALQAKLYDVAEIFSAYDTAIEHDFADKLDDTRRAADFADKYHIFSDYTVFVDAFDRFSGAQLQLLGQMFRDSEKCVILFTKTSLNVSANSSIGGSEWEEYFANLIYRTAKKYDNNAVFKAEDAPARTSACDSSLYVAPDVHAEARFIAAKTHELISQGAVVIPTPFTVINSALLSRHVLKNSCKSKKSVKLKSTYRHITPDKIAILTRSKSRADIISAALREYDIDVFMDFSDPIIRRPLVWFILSVIDALDFSTESFLRYIKSGFVRVPCNIERGKHSLLGKLANSHCVRLSDVIMSDSADSSGENLRLNFVKSGEKGTRVLSRKSIFEFEKAIQKYRLKSEDLLSPFRQPALRHLEPLRNDIIGKLQELKKSADGASGKDITMSLCDFMINKLELQKTILFI